MADLSPPGDKLFMATSLALERRNPAILDCRQFACPQAVFDFLLKQNIFQANETAGSLVIILQAGRLLVCRQADF